MRYHDQENIDRIRERNRQGKVQRFFLGGLAVMVAALMIVLPIIGWSQPVQGDNTGLGPLSGSSVSATSCVVSNGSSEAMLSIDSTQAARGINFDSAVCGGALATPSLYYNTGTTRFHVTNGFSVEAGTIAVRSATAGLSIGSAGSEYLGIAAGDNKVNVAAALYNVNGGPFINTGNGAGSAAFLIGNLSINATAVGNFGAAGPDDLMTYTLAANSQIAVTHTIRITAWGTCANNANAKTFTLNYGSQVILTHACTVSVANERWSIRAQVVRTGASTQDWWSEYMGSTGAAGAFEYDPEIGTATQNETASITIKMQATASTADNDIVQEGMIIEYL